MRGAARPAFARNAAAAGGGGGDTRLDWRIAHYYDFASLRVDSTLKVEARRRATRRDAACVVLHCVY